MAEDGTSRCPEHRRRDVPRDRAYRELASSIVAGATICALCGKPPTAADGLVTDHIIPRARGGSDDASNLQAAHRTCNARKSARLPSYPGVPRRS
jgi:5-methylcytosine-specific restriction endonuclease McrA